jgi:hypothetical protein
MGHLPRSVPHYGEVSTDALSREAGVHYIAKLSVSVTCSVLRKKDTRISRNTTVGKEDAAVSK